MIRRFSLLGAAALLAMSAATGALAQTIQRTLNLTRARQYRSNSVAGGHA